MKHLVDRLRSEHSLPPDGYAALLDCTDPVVLAYLQAQAHEVAVARFGRYVYIRGLIEISNRCRNNCYYCGIRCGNTRLARYALTADEILACCREGYDAGFRTFVLQGGEDPAQTNDWVAGVVARIRRTYPDCAITLSLGEKSLAAYERFRRAGADRYLLRHETRNTAHYHRLHPPSMSPEHRLQCLSWLKASGYQTGTGIMVGTPGQTTAHLVEDLCYIRQLHPEMIGIGPFIPHRDTPFAGCPAGSLEMTLRLLSIFRLMFPAALIPSTTALATLSPEGRCRGIQAGANVVMPNLTPAVYRSRYALYDRKAAFGAEAAEGLALLRRQLAAIGYELSAERGDYKG